MSKAFSKEGFFLDDLIEQVKGNRSGKKDKKSKKKDKKDKEKKGKKKKDKKKKDAVKTPMDLAFKETKKSIKREERRFKKVNKIVI